MELTAEHAWARLKDGNERFVRGEARSRYSPAERTAVAEEPRPFAVIVGCSDSRVPIEAVFDLGVGDAFVIRSAGQVLADPGLASVRFGVEQWGIPLIVVLGHENCLAVQAAMTGNSPRWLQPITDYIAADLSGPAETIEDEDSAVLVRAVDEHALAVAAALRTYLGILPLAEEPPPVVAGTYQCETGAVRWLDF